VGGVSFKDLFHLAFDVFRADLRGFSRGEEEEEKKEGKPMDAHTNLGSDQCEYSE
jgi:hypothetical protein